MSSNPFLESVRSMVGREITESPSPFLNWLRPTVIEAEERRLVFSYRIRREMLNPAEILHGGVTGAIIDDIFGATMFTLGERVFYTTINNSVDYFSPARRGDIIIAETRIIKKGRQFVNLQCEVWNEDRSRMIARGTTNMFRTDVQL